MIEAPLASIAAEPSRTAIDLQMRDEIRDLHAQISSLQGELAALRSAVNARASEPEVEEDAPPPRDSLAQGAVEEPDYDQALAEQREEEHVNALDSMISASTDGTGWGANMEAEVAGLMAAGEMQGTHLVDVQCGDSFCRVHLAHDDADAQLAAAQIIPVTAPFNTNGMIRFVGDEDNPQTLVYMSRKGERLPTG